MDYFNIIIDFLKANLTPTTIIAAFIMSVIIKGINKLFFYLAKVSANRFNSNNKTNVRYLISFYENKLIELEELKNMKTERVLKIANNIMESSLSLILLISILFIIKEFSGNMTFFAFFGAAFTKITSDIFNIISDYKLIRNAKKYKESKVKLEEKITKVSLLLDSVRKKN